MKQTFLLFFFWFLALSICRSQPATADFTCANPSCGSQIVSFTNTSTNGTVFLWIFGDPGSGFPNNNVLVFNNNPQIHLFSAYGDFDVTLYAYGNTDTASVTKRIKVAPQPALNIFPGSFNVFCTGDTGVFLFISATADPRYKYDWTPKTGFVTSSTISSIQINPRTTTTYTCNVIDTTTGCTNSKSVNIFFAACSISAAFSFTPPTCSQYKVDFSNQSLGAHHYKWYFGDPGSGASNFYYNTDINEIVSHTFSASGNFTVSMAAFDSLETKRDSVVRYVVVFDKSVVILYNNDTSICEGQAVSLNAFGDGVYGWTPTADIVNPGAMNTIAKPKVSTWYKFSNSRNGCNDADSFLVTVNPIPSARFFADTVCEGRNTQFIVSLPGPGIYKWQFGDGDSATGANPQHLYDSSGIYTATLKVTTNGCDSTFTTKVVVIDPPEAVAGAESLKVGIGDPVIKFRNFSKGAVSYVWDFGDGTTSTLVEPSNKYQDTGNYVVVLQAIDAKGCDHFDTLQVRIEDVYSYHIPNAISPNKNGPAENEKFKVYGLGITAYKMTIYNRWGQVVFESEDPNETWDADITGEAVQSDYFTYYTKFKDPTGKRHIYKGLVTVIR